MTSSEKKIEKKLRLAIESLGGLCLKIPATFFAGIPDRLCICPGGLVFFVETKGEGLKLRPRQLYVAKQLESLGVKVYVANSEAMVSDLLEALKEIYTPKAPKAPAQVFYQLLVDPEEARYASPDQFKQGALYPAGSIVSDGDTIAQVAERYPDEWKRVALNF